MRFGLIFKGGPIELEHMGAADASLAVHRLHSGGYCQQRGREYRQIHRLGGPLGAAPARDAPTDRSVLVRPSLCYQVAQRATHRLNEWPRRSKTNAKDGPR